jgi:hypothetical protein
MHTQQYKKIALFVGVLIVTLASVALASWTEPTVAAPYGNMPIPVHEGASQVKLGGLSVQGFAADDASIFEQVAGFYGTLFGGTASDTDSTLHFGGTVSSKTYDTNVSVTGQAAFAKDLNDGGLSVSQVSTKLCADNTGTINRCDVGSATGCPSDQTRLYDGSCGYSVQVNNCGNPSGCLIISHEDGAQYPGRVLMTSVTGIPGTIKKLPNGDIVGVHDKFNGAIQVNYTNSVVGASLSIALNQSGVTVSCIPIGGGIGSVTFPATANGKKYEVAPPTADLLNFFIAGGSC